MGTFNWPKTIVLQKEAIGSAQFQNFFETQSSLQFKHTRWWVVHLTQFNQLLVKYGSRVPFSHLIEPQKKFPWLKRNVPLCEPHGQKSSV